MAKFLYTVQDSHGNVSTGNIEAPEEDQAVVELQNRGYFILSIQSEGRKSKIPGVKNYTFGEKVKGQDLAFFSEQLATLLTGGVPLVRSLSLLAEHAENRQLGNVVSGVMKEVSAGGAFYKALEKHPKIFDTLWVSLIQAGELSGQLPAVLRQVSGYIQSQESMKGRIVTAISYPAVLLVFSGGVLTYFMIGIVPVFSGIFKEFNMDLPLITQVVMAVSGFLAGNFVLIIAGIIGLFVAFKAYTRTETGLYVYNRFTMRLPIFGKLVRHIMYERLLTTMTTLIRSGVSILNTIMVLEGAFSKNLVIKRALYSIRTDVAAGKSISMSFKNTGVFPGIMTEMLWMGEESGKLPDMITTLSKFYAEQINQFLARFSSLIDPVLIVGIGGLIGIVVLSVFLPIFKLSQISLNR